MSNADESQELVLRAYTMLRLLQPEWGGSLIVAIGLGPEGVALAMAANIAGAVCLSVEEQPELLKAAMRSGSCDFIVNSLDEALRAMKNEVRKRQPISVGLQGSFAHVLREIVDRGVQPELLVEFGSERLAYYEEVLTLQRRGCVRAALMQEHKDEEVVDAAELLDTFVKDQGWTLESFSLVSAAALKNFDACAAELLPPEDEIRRRWLRSAGRIVQRQRPLQRVLWTTSEESLQLRLQG